jgi:hypothetical protein
MSVKGFKNAFRSCPNSSDNFPDFSRIYSHFSLSIFYLLEGSKIFFMNSKHFIWIVHVPMCLWEFSWNFCDYRSIFRVFKQILGFSGIVFALKIISKKRKSILSIWAEPEGPTQVHTGPAVGPRGAHLSPREPIGRQLSMANTLPPPPALGVRALDCCSRAL